MACRVCTHAMKQPASPQYFILTSTLDALQGAEHLILQGTAICFDEFTAQLSACLLYTSDAAAELTRVDIG